MVVLERLDKELKESMKAKDEVRLSVIRAIRTALKNRKVQLIRELTETEVMAVIQTQAKQRKDSIEQFQKGGRDDLVRREEAELAILETYLPQTLTSDELDAAITAAIEETGAATVKDLGRVMKALMGRFGTRVDGKAAGERVRALLSGGH